MHEFHEIMKVSFSFLFEIWSFIDLFTCIALPPLCKENNLSLIISQWAFTCSKLTIETLEQGVKYVQS